MYVFRVYILGLKSMADLWIIIYGDACRRRRSRRVFFDSLIYSSNTLNKKKRIEKETEANKKRERKKNAIEKTQLLTEPK
mgnify:CR=1 FL=1